MDRHERIDVRIAGRVQGVGFRWWARSRAAALGLTGWVANEDDDRSVRLVAEGPREHLATFEQLLRDGPPSARVERVEVHRAPASGGFEGFEITRS